jgi:hypothetical protein
MNEAPLHRMFYATNFKSRPALRFIRYRPTVLDNFPHEVIREYIFPHLDYESRIQLNQCLPPWDRLSKKIPEGLIEAHDSMIVCTEIKKYILRLDLEFNLNSRYALVIKLFRLFFRPRYFHIIQTSTFFRETLIKKAMDFIEEICINNSNIDIDIKVRLISLITRLLKKIKKQGPYTMSLIKHNYVPLTFQ